MGRDKRSPVPEGLAAGGAEARDVGARCRLSARLGLLLALAALVPLVVSSDFLVRIGVNGLLLALLAVGLNVSVGWAGLLDLGFVAFYGFGAYTFALLSSDQLGIHLPTLLAVPIVILTVGLLGLLLGLPSWRLSGDYLAIVTLFFSQIFLELALNVDRLGVDLTGGPNGISGRRSVLRSSASSSRARRRTSTYSSYSSR